MFNWVINFIGTNTPIFYLIQSVWRDEAFSYFMALPPVFKIIVNTANDFNPPLYYLLLHFWLFLSGKSDILIRILSFLFHLGGVYYAFLLGRKLNGKNQAYYLAVFYLLNPMLLYYAFEIRMYSLYALLSTAAIYYFYMKRWKGYIISSVLGLYSHSFFILIILSLSIYNFIHRNLRKYLLKTIAPVIFFLPWIPVLAVQFVKSKESWLYPVDLRLIKSALGNLFTSYEGTPGHIWNFTAILSLFIILFSYIGFRNKKLKSEMFVIGAFIPLFLILLYSVIKRPIYVNRYLIFIAVFEILAIYSGIISITDKNLKQASAILWLFFIILFNFYIVPFRKKTDFKSTFMEINKIAKETDEVYARTPIGYLESVYYYKNPENTFVYNPQNIHIPEYIGVNLVFPNASRSFFPLFPVRTFMVNDDASYEVIVTTQ